MLCCVLLLSRVIGRQVQGPDGRAVGRLRDLTVRLDGRDGPRSVARAVVRTPGGPTLLIPWQAVARIPAAGLQLRTDDPGCFAVAALGPALDPDEILLVRDVLDTQVVDVVGQRLARVADVLLARTPDGGLDLVGVEVGFGGVLRRLGLGRIGPGQDVVAWSGLHLTSERGHAVQLSTPRAAVHRLNARGLAALVSRVDTEAATEILAARDPGLAARAVETTHPSVGERLMRALPASYRGRILDSMPAEHARRWRERLSRRPPWRGRRMLRSMVWPHRRHLIRDRRA